MIYLQDQILQSRWEGNLLSSYMVVQQEASRLCYIWCQGGTLLFCSHSNNKCFCIVFLPHSKLVLYTTVEKMMYHVMHKESLCIIYLAPLTKPPFSNTRSTSAGALCFWLGHTDIVYAKTLINQKIICYMITLHYSYLYSLTTSHRTLYRHVHTKAFMPIWQNAWSPLHRSR